MTAETWDYGGVPVARFKWEIPASGEQHFIHARVNGAGILWTGETTNCQYGGGYTIGPQTFEELFAGGPPSQTGLGHADVAELRAHVEAHRRAGPPPIDPNPRDPEGETALHRAAAAGDAAAVRQLLAAGAPVSARTTDGDRTPLHRAAQQLRVPAAIALLEAGADVGARDSFDQTALDLAVAGFTSTEADRTALIAALLAAGAPASTPALVNAAGLGYVAIVEAMLERGADPNAARDDGATALLAGAHSAPLVRLLLAAGADPRAADRWRKTALHTAVGGGSAEATRLLVEAGADPDAVDSMGTSPRARAREIRRPDLEACLDVSPPHE